MIRIYTDGAALGNPGPGGFGTILEFNGNRKELSQGFRLTTNNRMELLAVIEGLRALKMTGIPVTIYSDSKYLIDGFTQWFPNWKRTNRKDYMNKDLWFQLDNAAAPHTIEWEWVKGHSGNPGNDRANFLAETAARNCSQI